MTSSTVRRFAAALALGVAAVATALLAEADPPRAGYAPDPPAHASAKQWVFDVRYQAGEAHLERARTATLKAPAGTARLVGRFAIELYIGKELLDRVRFDVPLAGAGPSERSPSRTFRRPTFDDVTTSVRVQMADDPRATYVQIIDRATGEARRFWWPPEENGQLVPFGGAAGDAGADAAPQRDGGVEAQAPGSSDGGPASDAEAP